MATQAEIEALLKMKDEMSAKIEAIGKRVTSLTEKKQKLDSTSAKVKKGFAELGSELTGLSPKMFTVAGGIAAVGVAMAATIRATVQMGDRITNLSRQFQMSTDAVQRLEAGGRGLGISFEMLGNESNFLAKTLGSRSEGVLGALEELGLSYTRLSKMSPEQRLLAVHRAVAQIDDPLRQAAVGAELLGRGFQKMTEADLAEFEKEMNAAVIASKEAISAGDRLGDAWDKLKASSLALAADGLLPVVSALGSIIDNLNFAIDRFSKYNQKMKEAGLGTWSPEMGGAPTSTAPRAGGGFVGPTLPPEVAAARDRQRDLEIAAEEKAKKARDKAREALEKHNAEMEKVWARLNKTGIPTIRDLGKSFEELEKPLRDAQQALMSANAARWETQGRVDIAHATAAQQPFLQEAGYTNARNEAARELAANQARAAIPKIVPLKLEDDFADFGLSLEAAADIAQIFGEQLGVFGDALVQGSAAANLMKQGLDEGGFAGALNVATGAAMGFAAVMNATGSGTQGQRAGAGALAGAQAGAAFGPIGMGVGAAVGAIVGWLRGKGPADVGKDAGRDMGANLSQGLMEAIHKSGENAQMFLREIWEEGGIGLDRLAEEAGDLFSMFERGEISESGLLGELAEVLPILIENFGDLGDVGQEQIMRILGAAEAMGISLGAAGDALERLAAGIPETTLEGMAEALGISVEKARELAELMGVTMQTDLERLADDLDIPVDKLQELGAALKEQFGINIEDVQKLLDSMGITIEELAEKLGVELPAAAAEAAGSVPEGGAALDPLVFGNTAGDAIAGRLMPGQNKLSEDIGLMRGDLARIPQAMAQAVKEAVAQIT